MGFMIIAVENVPPSLRGRLAVWLVELQAGLYAGNYSRRVREMLWEAVLMNRKHGHAVMAWQAPNEIGFEFVTAGLSQRMPRDMDGVKLMAFIPDPRTD
ncbi:MAG: type I-E CRISPR-associated endoribonuclease Cas2e [Methanoculleaceae archaeon]